MINFKNLKMSQTSNGITRIILNDPSSYNSLSGEMIGSLLSALDFLNKNLKSKVIIIEGSGKGFSAGHNLKEINLMKNKTSYLNLFKKCSKLMSSITNHKNPIIAKIHGGAFAAGCQLVASCDLAYSSKDSIFATPGVNIGLFCSTPMVALSRNVNRKESMEMLLTGKPIKANIAKKIGLINDCYASSKLEKEVLKIANMIASKSNLVIKMGKSAFYKQLEMPIEKAYEYTGKIMAKNMMTADAKEGINSFIKKRLPIWKNK